MKHRRLGLFAAVLALAGLGASSASDAAAPTVKVAQAKLRAREQRETRSRLEMVFQGEMRETHTWLITHHKRNQRAAAQLRKDTRIQKRLKNQRARC